MQRTWILAASTACLLALGGYVGSLEQRLGTLESEPDAGARARYGADPTRLP